MSLIRQLMRPRNDTAVPFTNIDTPPSVFGGLLTRTGLRSTRERALRLAAVWACVRIRAETIGMLPVQVVQVDGDERHPVDLPPWLIRPNPETTRFELFERTAASIDTDGNAFWGLERDNLGRLQNVWPLAPAQVQVFRGDPRRKGDVGPKLFRISNEEYTTDQILHISGFSLPGRLRGLNPVEQHAHALGLAAAAEEYGEAFFGNGTVMAGVIEAPTDPGPDNVKRMQSTFARDHSGIRNAHKPGFLFGGAKWVQLTIPNDTAQFLETRKFQTTEIARIFRVPPHKIGDLERATFSNIEHQAIEWVTDGVMPTTTRIESAVVAAGLLDRDQALKFNLAGLLRGDTVSRYAAYAIGRQWGWLSADDIRGLEDMNPLPDGIGGTYLEPLNMVPAGERPEPEVIANALRSAGVNPELVTQTTKEDR